MLFTHIIAMIAVQATGVLSAVVTEAQCGKLGIMKVDMSTLSPDVDVNAIRQCADHPTGMSLNNKRDCWFGAPAGCTNGYCWKQCDTPEDGFWCWTATNGGVGVWNNCTQDSDCTTDMTCGQGVGCTACGCSC